MRMLDEKLAGTTQNEHLPIEEGTSVGKIIEELEESMSEDGFALLKAGQKKKINFDLPKLDKQVIEMLELDQNEDMESKQS